jgi:Tfp pilus assembly protein PilO
MFKELDNKIKFYVINVLVLVVLIIGYNTAISPTLSVYNELQENKTELLAAKNAPSLIAGIENELAELESIVGKLEPSYAQFQKKVLGNLVELSQRYDTKIKVIHEPTYYESNGYEVQTLNLTLKGSFIDITKIIDGLQNKNKTGHLASVNYRLVENKRRNEIYLETDIAIQNFKKL